MDCLFRPWRMEYILSEKPKECIFCKKCEENQDKKNYILKRFDTCLIMMNIYPYNNGHLMVAPHKHASSLEGLNKEELSELMMAVAFAVGLLKKAMKSDGFNIGLNVGRVAGAGVEDHIHIHIVPRWEGDTNFMPLIAEARVIPELLDSTYEKLLSLL